MSALNPYLQAALDADRATVTLLLEITLPNYALRLLVGSGFLPWGQKMFLGDDPNFGTIAAIDEVEDGEGDQAPSFGFSMFPPSTAAAAQLCSASYQNSPVSVWLAGVYPDTGLLVPDPYLIFSGFLDQQTLKVGKGTREVDFQCVSQFDLLLANDEGAYLSDAFHQSIWPGETAFANITGIEQSIYWGVATPNPGSVQTNISYGPYPGSF